MPLSIDLTGQSVLITGGTKGIGLATGLKFGQAGAKAYLTHKWGSADEDAIRKQFTDIGAPEPVIVQADVAEKDDVKKVIEAVGKHHDALDIFISNVGFALVTPTFDDYKLKSYMRTIEYCSWPLISHLKEAKKQFGRYPKYAIGLSSDGPDRYYPGYDFVANSKAVLETFVKYISGHLHGECHVNVVRAGIVLTESFQATFGEEFYRFLQNRGREFCVTPEEVADGIVAACSGLMDAMSGHVLVIDRGAHNRDNIIHLLQAGILVPAPEKSAEQS
ncbi:MAG: SDR family oxidoreductase [Planctomycetota bacterium]